MIKLLKKLSYLLITIVIFLITIILFKSNHYFKEWFWQNVLDNNLSFTTISKKYETLFGNPMPFKDLIEKPVFSEKIKYVLAEKYENGVMLNVENNLIPSISKGLVIFIGKKNNQNCVIVEQNNIDISYCMLINIGVKLYDHVEEGSYIGEVNKKLVLYFIKDGEFLNYEDFI